MKLPVSLVVITLNEERNIERCLQSVAFASEIIVVDSGSQDATIRLSEALGAKVIHQKWLGFGPQKAFAVTQASQDWILSLDADEALSPELAAEIQSRFSTLDPRKGYEMPRKSWFLGRWITHGGWYPDWQLRLFNRQFSKWNPIEIHERVTAPETERMKSPLLHWVFRDISHQVQTNDRYSSLQALERHQRGETFSLFRLITKPLSKFVECYFWKLGFLDGMPGFIIAFNASHSIFMRTAKMWEIQKLSKKEKQK